FWTERELIWATQKVGRDLETKRNLKTITFAPITISGGTQKERRAQSQELLEALFGEMKNPHTTRVTSAGSLWTMSCAPPARFHLMVQGQTAVFIWVGSILNQNQQQVLRS